MARHLTWALPGIVFTLGLAFGACSQANDAADAPCVTAGTGAGSGGAGGATPASSTTGSTGSGAEEAPFQEETEGAQGNTFHHPNDPAYAGQKDPFEILKERMAEGPPEIRTRLHSCSRIPYSSLGAFLTSRGVDLSATSPVGGVPTAGELYAGAGDSLGAPRYDVRQGEAYFYNVAAGTKLLDIFVQSAAEIIANIKVMPACGGEPMFDPVTSACVYSSLSCIMGRPATDDDLDLCNLMISQAKDPVDLENTKQMTVAVFLSAAHSCE